jgi:flagellar protein FliJ
LSQSHSNFPLQSVLQLRETHRDQCRQQWQDARSREAAAEQVLTGLQTQLDQTLDRLSCAVAPGTLNVEELLAFKTLELSLRQQLKDSQQDRQQTAEDTERHRSEFTEADRQVRVLQRLAERQHQQHQRNVAARESLGP